MSDDKKTDDNKASRKTSDMARRIWLAGIGAYGKAFEEGRDMVRGLSENLSDRTSDTFETLAEKGEKIETAAKVQGAKLAGRASGLTEELQSTLAIDERIAAMRERLSGNAEDRHDVIETRLDAIEAKLDKLLKAQEAPKKPAAKRTTTTRTKKAPAKKPAAKKPAAKKPAAKK
ncbi:phasin family protein [uncultured Algimonas sp.]|uniref:phasin family protein n=1 Tax=uncultured Algimonas sp. TaxID=1547920 RepID=UPI00261FF86C|nr:phasin family protein [uncultured Algimonas sp.]